MSLLPLPLHLSLRALLMGSAMLLTTWLTVLLTPSQRLADQQPAFQLESMIPVRFGDWQIDTTVSPVQVDPQLQSVVDKLYSQTLARTYLNTQGQRVMLSVAYGGEQSNNLQVHYPEVCYAAQGFQVSQIVGQQLPTPFGNLPIKRLLAEQGRRSEPITYWITVGDKAVKTGLEQKLQRLTYSLTGRVADGMLVRVSTIHPDQAAAYAIEDQFIRDLLGIVGTKDRERLIGTPGAAAKT